MRLVFGSVDRLSSNSLHPSNNLIGNVRHNLHGLTQIVTFSLFAQYRIVDFPTCDIVVAFEAQVQETFVIA